MVAGCQVLRNSQGPALTAPAADLLRVATYNVHYIALSRKAGAWGTDHWERRKAPLNAAFEALGADIVAMQEMESFGGGNGDTINLARTWLAANNPDYSVAAIGDWKTFPSTQPVFYKHDKYAVEDQGWFFFSETPDEIYSRTFNGSYPAFASWVRFRQIESECIFSVVNVHVDYSSRDNRTKSVDLIVSRIKPWIDRGQKVLFLGDLNARLGSSLHKRLESVGLQFAPVRGSTFHFNRGINLFGAIDHIGYTNTIRPVGEPAVLRDKFGDVWPTDHYPVVADLRLSTQNDCRE